MNAEDDLKASADQNIPEGYDPALYRIRHSLAHIMAQAVIERYPGTKTAIGPPIENGFYYDFDLPDKLGEEDLKGIENRMKEIIRGRHPFRVREVSAAEARELFEDNPYKRELVEGLTQGGYDEYGNALSDDQQTAITVYQQDTFLDLCRGPHVEHTGEIKYNAFKLMNVSSAYWHGDENNPMLTRIYGTAWRDKSELNAHLKRLEEAQKRDHRRLGRELELFMGHEFIGTGLPIWLPNGATVRRLIEEYIEEEERKAGYLHVYSPHLGKQELYEKSGHWEHYKDEMFPPIELKNENLVLRPMNCPHHILIYAAKLHSYRDLPIRIAELGTMYRFERSGKMGGLSRVRAMTLNDAHIFCTPSQVKEEFADVMRLVERAYRTLGIADYTYRLSLRDKADRGKYVDNDAMWDMAEDMLRETMDALDLPYVEVPGEAAFYGPKLDIQFRDVLGREETYSSIQIDFHLPNQFDLTYVDQDDRECHPVIIHRGVLSTMERMVAYLIELYAGAFPVWLAPIQAVLIPISDRHIAYAQRVTTRLTRAGFRVEIDDSNNRINAKIRNAQLRKIPYMLVVGDREVQGESVSPRLRTGENLAAMPVQAFEDLLQNIVSTRSLSLVERENG